MTGITIIFSPQWTVALTDDHPTARLAARELRGFLRCIRADHLTPRPLAQLVWRLVELAVRMQWERRSSG